MIAHPAALQTLIDSSPAHLFAVDRDYRYTAFNHSHARHTLEFYGTQIAIGSSSLDAITDPITRDRAHSALDRALGGEQFVELAVWPEIHLASLAVEMTLIPQLDSDGAVCGVCIKVQELSEVLYRSLFEDISAAILFVDAGSGAILDANPAACTFYGYSHAELTHLNIGDIMALAPDETRERIRRVADGEINQVLTHHRLANGEMREVDVTLGRRKLGERVVNVAIIKDLSALRQQEQALRESDERFTQAFRLSPLGFNIFQMEDGRCLDANPAYLEMVGYSREEVIGHTAAELNLLVEPEERPVWMGALQSAGQIGELEIRYRTKSGAVRAALAALKTIEMQGETLGIAMTIDITARKQAEARLAESETRYRLLFENLTEGFSLNEVILDENGRALDFRILAANAAYERHTGLKPAEVIGKTGREINPGADPRQVEKFMQVARTGQPLAVEFYATGLERYFRTLSYCPQPGQFATLVEDITERKQIEEIMFSINDILEQRVQQRTVALQRSNHLMRLFVEHSPAAIAMFDREMCYIAASRRFSQDYGLGEQKLVGRSHYEVFPEISPEWKAVHQRCLAGAVERSAEDPFPRQDGSLDWVRWEIHPWYENPGQVGGLVLFSEVITTRKQAEQRLRENEARFRHMFEDHQAVMLLIDPATGSILDANRAAQAFYGYSHAALVSRSITEINALPPEEVHREMEKAQRTEKKYFEFPHRLADGAIRTVEVYSSPLAVDQKPVLFSVIHDITARKQAESALRAAQTRLATIISAANLGTWEWNVQTGEALFNARWAEIVGCTLAELAPISIQTWIDLAHPDDLKISNAQLAEVFAGQRTFYDVECRMRHRLGHWVWVQDSGSVTAWTPDGKPLTMSGTHMDITARKQAEEELRLRNQLVELSHEPILVWDLERGIVDWNAGCESLYGYTRQEAIGQVSHTLLRACHPLPLAELIAHLECAGCWSGEVSHWTRDGQEIIVDSRQELLAYDGRRLVLETNRDITAEKRAQEALEDSARRLRTTNTALEKAVSARDEFLAAMSHELRTPLSGILGFIEILQLNLYGALNEKQSQAVHNIQVSGERLLALINEVLIYTQIQSGGLALNMAPTALVDVCRASLAMLRTKADAKQQRLDFSITPEAIVLRADATQLKRALANLLDNAVKFTPTGGDIKLVVTGQPEAGEVRLTVSDNGIGIKAEDLPNLFQPFIQLDARLSRQYEGTGLGLALVKGIVELHGGRVEVASVFGRGSSFTIVLPWKP